MMMHIHQMQPLCLLVLVVQDPMEGQRVVLPPPVEVNGEQECLVSNIEYSQMYHN